MSSSSIRLGMVMLACSLPLLACSSATGENEEPTVETDEAAASSPCPSAPSWLPLSPLYWKTTTQTAGAVWSSDGTRIATSELTFEERKPFDPLAGTTKKQKFCHRVSVQDGVSGKPTVIGTTFEHQVGRIRFMQPAGYLVVESFIDKGMEIHRLGLDGARKLIARADDGCATVSAVPSPDGSRIAVINLRGYCPTNPNEEPPPGATEYAVTVTILDATGTAVAEPTTLSLFGYADSTWNADGRFVVSDHTTVVAFDAKGVKGTASLPACYEPPTTSSEVDAQGRTLGYDEKGKLGIITTDPGAAFGVCAGR